MLFISGTLFHIQTVANIRTWELPSATATFFFLLGSFTGATGDEVGSGRHTSQAFTHGLGSDLVNLRTCTH